MKSNTDAASWENPELSGRDQWSSFMAHGQNVQIDPLQVRVGDMLLIALKGEVKVGSQPHRLIAPWGTIQVRTPGMCCDETGWHVSTVCVQCVRESWLWDYIFRNVRTLRNFAHGTPRAYDYFGCRCELCIRAHRDYLNGTLAHETPARKREFTTR